MTISENEAIGRLTHLWGMLRRSNPRMGEAVKVAIDRLCQPSEAEPVDTIMATVRGGEVLLRLPVDRLVFACENHPEVTYRVRDPEGFARWIAQRIVDHDTDEAGNSALYRLLDDLFEEAASDDVIDCEPVTSTEDDD